jgi:hypothetical protein
MKKHIVLAVLASALLGAASFAEAGNGNRGYRNGHHNGYSSIRYGHYPTRNHHGYARRSHYRHGDYRGHHDYHKGLRIAAGAVVIGSLIHAINHDRRERVVYRTRRVAPGSDYWYRVDTDGQCVEVRLNQQGQEVWTYVDSSYCR